jgi:hypothetical protein
MNFIVGLLPAGLVCVWIWLSDICLLDRFYLAQRLLSLAMHVTQFVVKKPCFKKLSDFHQFVWEIGRKTGVADFFDRRFLEPYLELRRLHESKIIQWNVTQKVCPSPIQKLFEVLWFYRQIKYTPFGFMVNMLPCLITRGNGFAFNGQIFIKWNRYVSIMLRVQSKVRVVHYCNERWYMCLLAPRFLYIQICFKSSS